MHSVTRKRRGQFCTSHWKTGQLSTYTCNHKDVMLTIAFVDLLDVCGWECPRTVSTSCSVLLPPCLSLGSWTLVLFLPFPGLRLTSDAADDSALLWLVLEPVRSCLATMSSRKVTAADEAEGKNLEVPVLPWPCDNEEHILLLWCVPVTWT
jgi:hypothetical protein